MIFHSLVVLRRYVDSETVASIVGTFLNTKLSRQSLDKLTFATSQLTCVEISIDEHHFRPQPCAFIYVIGQILLSKRIGAVLFSIYSYF